MQRSREKCLKSGIKYMDLLGINRLVDIEQESCRKTGQNRLMHQRVWGHEGSAIGDMGWALVTEGY